MRLWLSSVLRSVFGRRLVAAALVPVLAAGCRDATAPDRVTGRPDAATGPWAAVAVGNDFSCALDREGRAYCWGDNTRGRLGVGDTARVQPAPRPVVGGLTFHAIATGSHVCALTADGQAYCWGPNGAGQLGVGAPVPDLTATVTRPTPVVTLVRFSQISIAGHTCGVARDGAAYCWGPGAEGQLGVGPIGPCGPGDRVSHGPDGRDERGRCAAPVPTPVAGALRFASVSAGERHTCGVTTDAAAYCWGSNHDAPLGTAVVAYDCALGATVRDPQAALAPCRRFTPVAVATPLRFRQIAAASRHTCGLAVDGRAYCWGLATGLQQVEPPLAQSAAALGTGTTAPGGSVTPVPVAGGLTFRDLFARATQSCGVTTDGRAYCWGGNGWGSLGLGDRAPDAVGHPTPVPVPLAAASPVVYDRVACVVTANGRVFCWGGLNQVGELGNGTTSNHSLPVKIFGDPAPIAPPAP